MSGLSVIALAPHHFPSKNKERKNIPQIIQSRPPLSLLRPLHNLHPLHIRTKHLNPHLHPHPCQLISQQKGTIDPPQPDTQTHAGKGIAVLECHPQDVAGVHAARVAAVVKEGFAFARGVKGGELGVCYGCDGVFAGVAGARGRGVDFGFLGGCFLVTLVFCFV